MQTAPLQLSTLDPTSFDTIGQPPIFNEFLKWYENRHNSSTTATVAHTSTSFVGLTHSNSLGSWVLDSSATYHITGDKSFFFFSVYLGLFTFCNGLST